MHLFAFLWSRQQTCEVLPRDVKREMGPWAARQRGCVQMSSGYSEAGNCRDTASCSAATAVGCALIRASCVTSSSSPPYGGLQAERTEPKAVIKPPSVPACTRPLTGCNACSWRLVRLAHLLDVAAAARSARGCIGVTTADSEGMCRGTTGGGNELASARFAAGVAQRIKAGLLGKAAW